MTPEQIAGTSEGSHQTAFFAWCATAKKEHPDLEWCYHVPNGDSRGDKRSAMITGARLKAQGVKAGVPDIGLDVARKGFHGLRIELKRPGIERAKNGGCSDEQICWIDRLRSQGYCVEIAYSWIDAKNILLWYLT